MTALLELEPRGGMVDEPVVMRDTSQSTFTRHRPAGSGIRSKHTSRKSCASRTGPPPGTVSSRLKYVRNLMYAAALVIIYGRHDRLPTARARDSLHLDLLGVITSTVDICGGFSAHHRGAQRAQRADELGDDHGLAVVPVRLRARGRRLARCKDPEQEARERDGCHRVCEVQDKREIVVDAV
ncbi:hypothetical protein OH76DRAFT_1401611 [Lentinus brumalis]|uniref:Uncharacterized protein n=1 Tax=Lentinus brumalis TaxID=2498619 RepID=A0A371DFK4_9APHY|nr:hypothetical protein OH76DRAFT_1401611 [Polyporus brumalis]